MVNESMCGSSASGAKGNAGNVNGILVNIYDLMMNWELLLLMGIGY